MREILSNQTAIVNFTIVVLLLLGTLYKWKKQKEDSSNNKIVERTEDMLPKSKIIDVFRIILLGVIIGFDGAWAQWVLYILVIISLIEVFWIHKKDNFSLKKNVLPMIGFFVLLNVLVFWFFHFSTLSINHQNYYFERLDLNQLWERSTGYTQTIAIIDSGITNEAKELFQHNIVSIYNSIDGSIDVLDENEYAHGTQMASIIIGNGEAGVYGVAPSAQVVIIKAFEGIYSQTDGEILANAVYHAVEQEVDIINMSFGAFQVNEALEHAIESAIEAGIVVVAATGDYGQRDSLFPARMPGVVSVRAKDDKGNLWRYSNAGKNDSMSMYGVNIRGLTFDNEYIEMSGTSQAAALASGYIALIRDYHMSNDVFLTHEDIFAMLAYLNSNNQLEVDYLVPFQFSVN